MKVGDIHIEEIIFEQTKELLLRYGVKSWNMTDLSSACNISKRTVNATANLTTYSINFGFML